MHHPFSSFLLASDFHFSVMGKQLALSPFSLKDTKLNQYLYGSSYKNLSYAQSSWQPSLIFTRNYYMYSYFTPSPSIPFRVIIIFSSERYVIDTWYQSIFHSIYHEGQIVIPFYLFYAIPMYWKVLRKSWQRKVYYLPWILIDCGRVWQLKTSPC